MFYLFHGDDKHSQKETLAELQSKLGDPAMLELNTSRFEGASLTLSQLRHACDAVPFLAEKRLVIVTNLFTQAPPFLEELLAYLPHLPETTRLVFMEERLLPGRHPLVKLAESEKVGYVKAFKRPEGSALDKWIRQRVESLGGRIAPRAIYALATNAGNDLHLLANEIEKLALYKDQGETIEVEDVVRLSPYAAEASIFELVDAVGSRNGRIVASLLQQKINEGVDPFFLFSMFVRQFRLLIQVKELAESGARPPDIARAIKIPGFVAGKLLQQSHSFSLTQLEQIYAHLLDVDVGVKTGRTDMATALDLLVASLSVA